MSSSKPLRGKNRLDLLQELERRYEHVGSLKSRLVYWRKKYFWLFIVSVTKLIKRLLDITISSALLLILFPIMGLIAFVIKIGDGGPVLYTTDRVGKWGREFKFPKFRTMCINAESIKFELWKNSTDNVRFKMKNDPRVTKIGQLLRKSSLDELPQLWCVLIGNMTLVGPRPPLPNEVAKYTLAQRRRLDVTPGLTGLWQVSGRSEIPFKEQVQLDLEYIESQSLWLDIKIILKTIPAVIFGRGAY